MKKQKLLIEEVLYPFPDVEFAEKWQEWLDERKDRRTKPYTARGLQGAFRNLHEISGGDVQVAIKIIQQSIDQGWQGLFALKTQYNGKAGNPNNSGQQLSDDKLKAALFRNIANQ